MLLNLHTRINYCGKLDKYITELNLYWRKVEINHPSHGIEFLKAPNALRMKLHNRKIASTLRN